MTDWEFDRKFAFSADYAGGHKATHDVYVKGDGPPILILQELPGLGPETLGLIDRLAGEGFRVYALHFLGRFGTTSTGGNFARVLCMRRAFHLFRAGAESPIAAYFRALVRHVSELEGGAGVGVIGMCLTGSFALTMMADAAVLGGVASQPALPIMGRGKLPMSPADIEAARAGMAEKGPGLAMRYKRDIAVPDASFCAYEQAFGDDLELVEYDGRGHSLLTLHFKPDAFDRVVAYFSGRLG